MIATWLNSSQCINIHCVFAAAGVEENVTVVGSVQSHMLTDLEVERTYSVRMDSVTVAGHSHTSSKAIYQQTTRIGSGKSCFVIISYHDYCKCRQLVCGAQWIEQCTLNQDNASLNPVLLCQAVGKFVHSTLLNCMNEYLAVGRMGEVEMVFD